MPNIKRQYQVSLLIRKAKNYAQVSLDNYLKPQELISAVNDKTLYIRIQPDKSDPVTIPVLTLLEGAVQLRPAAGAPGRVWVDSTDYENPSVYLDTGGDWVRMGTSVYSWKGTEKYMAPVTVNTALFESYFGLLINEDQFAYNRNTNAIYTNEDGDAETVTATYKGLNIVELNENVRLDTFKTADGQIVKIQ